MTADLSKQPFNVLSRTLLVIGCVAVLFLAYFLWNTGGKNQWPEMLFAWVLITILVDEASGWLGYAALAVGVLPLLNSPPEQWFVIFPLIFGALFAVLILKHSGEFISLFLAAGIFTGTIMLADKIGKKIDPEMKFINNQQFQHAAITAMLTGIVLSFIYKIMQARSTRKAVIGQPQPASVPSSVATVQQPVLEKPVPEKPAISRPEPEKPVVVKEKPAAAPSSVAVLPQPVPEKPVPEKPVPEKPPVQQPIPQQPEITSKTQSTHSFLMDFDLSDLDVESD